MRVYSSHFQHANLFDLGLCQQKPDWLHSNTEDAALRAAPSGGRPVSQVKTGVGPIYF